MDKVLDIVDGIKRKITDQEYIDLMNGLSEISNSENFFNDNITISTTEYGNLVFNVDLGICGRKLIRKFDSEGMVSEDQWLLDGNFYRGGGDLPAHITYHSNGDIHKKTWYMNGKIGRKGMLPAIIVYYDGGSGKINREEYYEDGYLYRAIEYQPSLIHQHTSAVKNYNKDRELHSIDGNESVIFYDLWDPRTIRRREWHKNGVLIRTESS